MATLPVNNSTLRLFLDIREDFLRFSYLDLIQFGPSLAGSTDTTEVQTRIWYQVRELHRLRLVLLGQPMPSMQDWVRGIADEATADPEAWTKKRRKIFAICLETSDAMFNATPPDQVCHESAPYHGYISLYC